MCVHESKNVKIKINKIIILPVVLYWWETIREERRQMVFKNRVLRRISEPKRYEMTGGMRWEGYVACMEEIRNAHKILNEKPEGKT
jgi:hypothetical protein